MVNFMIIAVVAVIIGAAVCYIHRSKKNGIKCIGCPEGATCGGNCSGCSGCGAQER